MRGRFPLVVAALLTLSCWPFLSCDRRSAESALRPGDAPAASPAPPAVEPPPTVERTGLGPRGSLHRAFVDLGLEPAASLEMIGRLTPQLDPRRLPVETGVAAARNAAGQLVALWIRPERSRALALRRADGWTPTWESLPVQREIRAVTGTIESSVSHALQAVDHGTTLTHRFADIFQWDVDLLVEPRQGDRLAVVYEMERLGEVPAAIPTFDGELPRAGDALGVGRVLAASYDGALVRSSAFWYEPEDGTAGYYNADGTPLRKAFLKSPLNYRRISSGFSRARRHPVTRKVVPHHGVDFVAAAGTPVVSTADGRVVRAGWQGALGKAVTVRHPNGYETIYGHLSRFAAGIRSGAEVAQNEVVGYVGATGRATGAHLHYTLRRHGAPIDPMRLRNPPVEPLAEEELPGLQRVVGNLQPMLHRTLTAAALKHGEEPGGG